MHDASGLFWVSFMVKAFWGRPSENLIREANN